MANISDLLKRAQVLEPVSDTARLDIEVLLCHVLGKPRSYLYAWPEYQLEQDELSSFESLLERRIAGEPIAYLCAQKEFWSLSLEVNPSTLIPRPETEVLVETALKVVKKKRDDGSVRVLDLGTGTGAIALALASERPGWNILAVDSSLEAVELAKKNCASLGFENVEIMQSNWFSRLDNKLKFDLIVTNPPYISADDRHLQEGDVRFEPHSALVADDAGFADIENIISEAGRFLADGGCLLIEHGCGQAAAVRQKLTLEFSDIITWYDAAGLERVSGGWLREQ